MCGLSDQAGPIRDLCLSYYQSSLRNRTHVCQCRGSTCDHRDGVGILSVRQRPSFGDDGADLAAFDRVRDDIRAMRDEITTHLQPVDHAAWLDAESLCG